MSKENEQKLAMYGKKAEKFKAYQKKYYSDPINHKKQLERLKNWRKRNPDYMIRYRELKKKEKENGIKYGGEI